MLEPLRLPPEVLLDIEGRPLLERAAPANVQLGVTTELVECRYSGSRFKHPGPMNISALRQLQVHWADAVEGLSYLRSLYPLPTTCVRYVDLWRIGQFGAALPSFLSYRKDAPFANGTLPAHVAAIFKIVMGMNHAVLRLAEINILRSPDKSALAVNPDELYSFIEQQQLLISPVGVCAGPEKLIRQAITGLIEELPIVCSNNKTASLIPDSPSFLKYSYTQMNSLILDRLFGVISESLYARIRAALFTSLPYLGSPVADLALFDAGDDRFAAATVKRIVHMTFAFESKDESSELDREVNALSSIFDPTNLLLPKLRAGAADLLKQSPLTSTAIIDSVALYFALESYASRVSSTLKGQCLESLGLRDSIHLQHASAPFRPAYQRVRHLLATLFGVTFSNDLVVRSPVKALALSSIDCA